MVEAEECLRWGLISHLVPREEVLPKALSVARDLASKPPVAFRLTKRRLREATQASYDETIEAAVKIQAEAFASGEPQRVAAEFKARRAARRDQTKNEG
jgi:enoyl-CoA hydratase/carnithine racemase